MTDGETLTATTGSWTGTPAISYDYPVACCATAAATNCADIPGATGATYDADVRRRRRDAARRRDRDERRGRRDRHVRSDRAGGARPAGQHGAAGDLRHADGRRDADRRRPAPGRARRPSPTTTSGARATAAATNCADIPGATGATYDVTAGDVDGTLRVAVTATNVAGDATAESDPTAQVAPTPPVNTDLPVDHRHRHGRRDAVGDGRHLDGDADDLLRRTSGGCCDGGGSNCADIPGATGATYELTAGDVGGTLRVVVTATNAAGDATAESDPTPTIGAAAPSNTGDPSISGTTRDGETLTADDGTWTGTPVISYAHQWRRCDADGSGCVDIPGATDATYDLVPADIGSRLRVVVTATNAGGSVDATSPASAVVDGHRPGEHRGAVDLRHADRRGDPDGGRGHVDRVADDLLRVPVAALRQRRLRLRGHPRRDRSDVRRDARRHRRHAARRRDRHERRRLRLGDLRAHRPRRRDRPGRRAAPRRSRARRPPARPSPRIPAPGPARRPSPSPISGCAATPPAPPASRSRAPPTRPTTSRRTTSARRSACGSPARTPAARRTRPRARPTS